MGAVLFCEPEQYVCRKWNIRSLQSHVDEFNRFPRQLVALLPVCILHAYMEPMTATDGVPT